MQQIGPTRIWIVLVSGKRNIIHNWNWLYEYNALQKVYWCKKCKENIYYCWFFHHPSWNIAITIAKPNKYG